jgi:hypothetical protein
MPGRFEVWRYSPTVGDHPVAVNRSYGSLGKAKRRADACGGYVIDKADGWTILHSSKADAAAHNTRRHSTSDADVPERTGFWS